MSAVQSTLPTCGAKTFGLTPSRGREDRRRTGSVPYLDVVVAEESLQLLVLVGGAAAAVGETHQPAMTG